MQGSNEHNQSRPDDLSGKDKGMQGIDKAPGVETPGDTQQVVQETQRGKKVDADPSQEQEQPGDDQK